MIYPSIIPSMIINSVWFKWHWNALGNMIDGKSASVQVMACRWLEQVTRLLCLIQWHASVLMHVCTLVSGVPDFFDRTRFWVVVICPIIKCLTVLEFSFILFDLCLFITIFNFILNYVPIVTFWIFTYHKIWILLIIFCFIWNYWIIHFLTCLEVFWSVVS